MPLDPFPQNSVLKSVILTTSNIFEVFNVEISFHLRTCLIISSLPLRCMPFACRLSAKYFCLLKVIIFYIQKPEWGLQNTSLFNQPINHYIKWLFELLLSQLKAVLPLSSDLWQQQTIFVSRTAAHWMFAPFQINLCKL